MYLVHSKASTNHLFSFLYNHNQLSHQTRGFCSIFNTDHFLREDVCPARKVSSPNLGIMHTHPALLQLGCFEPHD